MFKKIALAAAVAGLFAGQALAASAFISNGSVKATIADSGTFDASAAVGLEFGGREFVNIDNRASWYWFSDGVTSTVAESNIGSNPFGAVTFGVGPSAATTFALGGWSFSQTVFAAGSDKLTVHLNLTNNTGSAVSGAMWGVGFDPDQDGSGLNTTLNTIVGSGNGAAVRAVGPLSSYRVTLANDTSAAATDIVAYINAGNCCGAVDPAVAYAAAQAVGFSTLADDSISLAYKFGSIADGQTVSIGYSYIFAVPEPETYAMMLAGLAAVGFVARRRKAG